MKIDYHIIDTETVDVFRIGGVGIWQSYSNYKFTNDSIYKYIYIYSCVQYI